MESKKNFLHIYCLLYYTKFIENVAIFSCNRIIIYFYFGRVGFFLNLVFNLKKNLGLFFCFGPNAGGVILFLMLLLYCGTCYSFVTYLTLLKERKKEEKLHVCNICKTHVFIIVS